MPEFLSGMQAVRLGGNAPTSPLISYRILNKLFGLILLGLIVAYAAISPSVENFLLGTLISACAMVPGFVWANGYVRGIPCFPLFAGLQIVYFGTSYVIGHPVVETYGAGEKFIAGLSIVGYLLLMTLAWILVGRVQKPAGTQCLIFDPYANTSRYLALLVFAVLFSVNSLFGIVNIPGELIGLIRPFVLGMSVIGIFLLAYNFGKNALTGRQKALFLALLILVALSQALTLALVSTYTYLASAFAGYCLSARRIPKVAVAITLVLAMVFQAGKYEMRRTYIEDGNVTVQLSQLPVFFGNWMMFGIESLSAPLRGQVRSNPVVGDDVESISILRRASLLQMLLLVEAESPSSVPFLGGDSYTGIPALFLPRILFPDKGNISEPMTRLSVAYGVLPIDSEGTSIAWGLLPEAFANFGYTGMAGLALVMGALFGLFARLCTGYSVFSARSIASIMVLTAIFGFESHAAAAASTFFQSLVAVVVASVLFARTLPNPGSEF